LVGIDEVLYNGKVMTIEREGLPRITRKVFGNYPKYQLVTSHIGRKSFATNFYEKISITYLLNFTGHKTERQLLTYISKTDVEKAKSTAKIFKVLVLRGLYQADKLLINNIFILLINLFNSQFL